MNAIMSHMSSEKRERLDKVGKGTDGVEAIAEGKDLFAGTFAELGGECAEAAAEQLGHPPTRGAHKDGEGDKSEDDRKREQSRAIDQLRVGQGAAIGRGQQNDGEDERDRAHVKHALYGVDGDLRGERDIGAARDQVGGGQGQPGDRTERRR